ncbi:aspartic peptidase domain-containing protein [Trametes gibbosa]|nr:aspartic peptidase domain-containing protein [Trametes gibbosa]
MGFLHLCRAVMLVPLLCWLSASAYGQATDGGFNMKVHPGANIGLATDDDTIYTVDITLGGQNFTVLLDTGSTDLWINTQRRDIKLTNATDLTTSEVYGQGTVQGNIAFAELKVGSYVVPSQIFLNATQAANVTVSVDGYMGISFDVSNIFATILHSWGNESAQTLGRSFITNIFAQNTSLPNNFDLQLGRSNQMDDISTGTFIVGGHSSQFGDIADAPKLSRVGNGRWTVEVDGMKINGIPFTFNRSSVSGVPEGKVVALLDSGFSAPPLPPAAVDAIYRSIPGSVFWQTGNSYVIPCNSSTMLSFNFAGQEFLVHPLDLALPVSAPILKSGAVTNVTVCQATYQYLNLDPTTFAGFDLILGDAFLRSVYASFDYGDANPMTNNTDSPFVQLLPLVDVYSAMDEFYDDRAAALAALPPTIDPAQFIQYPLALNLTGASSTSSSGSQDNAISGAVSEGQSGEDAGNVSGGLSDKTFKITALALLGANLLVGFFLFVCVSTICVRGMKGKTASVGSRYVPVRFKDVENVDSHEAEAAVPRYSD